eukprot:UN15118
MMNSSLQVFMEALEKTTPTSMWQSIGKITDGEVIHTIEAKDVTQVLAKYQSYESFQIRTSPKFFNKFYPLKSSTVQRSMKKSLRRGV